MRGEVIERALIIIRMFESGPVTAKDIMQKFNVSKQSAHRWINQVSRFMPVVEAGLDYSGGGAPAYVYELMRD